MADCPFETPVADVLPTNLRPSTLAATVSVHHLLCHTSGIADYAEEDESCPGYVEDYALLWTERPTYLIERPAHFLPLFADLPRTVHRASRSSTRTPATSCLAS